MYGDKARRRQFNPNAGASQRNRIVAGRRRLVFFR